MIFFQSASAKNLDFAAIRSAKSELQSNPTEQNLAEFCRLCGIKIVFMALRNFLVLI